MKILLAGAAAIALISVAAPASAETYGSIGYGRASTDFGITGADVDLDALTVQGGWRPEGGVFGVEAEASIGLGDDTVGTGVNAIDFELRHQYAIYATAQFPVTPQINVFGRVGFGNSDIEVSDASGTLGATDTDSVNFGLGGSYMFSEANGVRVDFTRHDFKGGSDADVIALSFLRNF